VNSAVPDGLALPPERRREVHLRLCQRALDVWEAFAAGSGAIVYRDSIVGMRHIVDTNLPRRALDAMRSGTGAAAVDADDSEPIAALQDLDIEFPAEIELADYAIYNLFRLHARHAAVDERSIARQALGALPEADREAALARALAETA
jgi:hypothetical protein